MSNIVGNYFRPAPLTKTRPCANRRTALQRENGNSGEGDEWGRRVRLGEGTAVGGEEVGGAVSAGHGFWAGAPSRGATPEPGHGS